MTERDVTARAAAARALGLEVSRARYLRTLDRVRRCERAARLLGRLGPLARVLPVSARETVEIASADARLVLVKLWTAGERYRRVLTALDRDPDRIDPGAGLSPAEFADLRQRLSDAPRRANEGDDDAVAATMADAREAIQSLLDARADDPEAFHGVDPETFHGVGPGRLASAAATAAETLTREHDARREARRRRHGARADAAADYRTPVGNSDQIRPAALESENVDPDLIASLADDEPAGPDDLAQALGTAEFAPDDDAASVEETIGASFDIEVSDPEGGDAPDDDRADATADEESGFEFGVATVDDERVRERG